MVKDFRKDFVDNEISKRKDLSLMTPPTNATNHVVSATIGIVKQHRKALKEGIIHVIAHYSHKVGSNIGAIDFSFKAKDNKDEGSKLIGILSCEENMNKLTTHF